MDIEPEVIEAVEDEVIEEEVELAEEGEDQPEEETGLVVNIDGEGEPDEPEHFREVRRKYREAQKRLKELEAKVSAPQQPALRPKPTAEDHDYNNEEFAADLEKWFAEKSQHDAQQAKQVEVQQKAEQRWQQRLAYYDEGKSKLGAQDYDDAEATVNEILAAPFPGIMADDVRLGIIKQGAKDPAALVYALAKNPAKAKELAEIEDPVEFAWKAASMEAGMKITRGGSKVPAPEKRIAGGSAPGVTATNDRTLEKLLAEADKTGDYTKVGKYQRQLKK